MQHKLIITCIITIVFCILNIVYIVTSEIRIKKLTETVENNNHISQMCNEKQDKEIRMLKTDVDICTNICIKGDFYGRED